MIIRGMQIPLLLMLGALGCTSARHPTVEGVGPPQPGMPLLKPARTSILRLIEQRVGALVVVVTQGERGAPASGAQLEMQTGTAAPVRGRTDTTGIHTFEALPPGAYRGVVRRLGADWQEFRVVIAPGYADTLELATGTALR